jgi:hypothetical protein
MERLCSASNPLVVLSQGDTGARMVAAGLFTRSSSAWQPDLPRQRQRWEEASAHGGDDVWRQWCNATTAGSIEGAATDGDGAGTWPLGHRPSSLWQWKLEAAVRRGDMAQMHQLWMDPSKWKPDSHEEGCIWQGWWWGIQQVVEDDGCGVEVATRVACWRPLIAWLRWSMEAGDKNGAGWGIGSMW